MGEYARQQMADDARRMFGGDWEPEDFDSPPKRIRPACQRCGKKFNSQAGVEQHARDKHKHKPKIAAHTGSAAE